MVKSNIAEQVSHWVHDEQASVTVQRIVQTFDLSWSDALSLLKGIPKHGHQYSLTRFTNGTTTSDEDPKTTTNDSATAFRLVKSPLEGGAEPEESSVWFALALEVCTGSVHSANEKDSNQFQDGMQSFSIPSSLRPWDKSEHKEGSKGFGSSIVVSDSMMERVAALGKRKANDAFGSQAPILPKAASARVVPTKKTVTTARSFFSSTTSSTTTKASATKAKTFPGSASTGKGKCKGQGKGIVKGTTTTKPKPPKHTSTLSFPPKNSEGAQSNKNSSTKRVVDEEKENMQNKSSSKVGNADDMVFDLEDSSDEEQDEASVQRPPKPSQQVTKQHVNSQKSKGSSQPQDGEDDEDASQNDDNNNIDNQKAPKRRRKRKVMVEKTSMDESGYLYTETQAEWQDIPSSEDEKDSVSTKSKHPKQLANKAKESSAKPKALKQQSLMGFFKKK